MPYSKCPTCGQTSHLNVADPTTWYAERYPDLSFGDLVPGTCFYCFGTITVDSPVIVRAHFSTHPDFAPIDARGIVVRITSSDDGDLYDVRFDGGDDVLIRGELRKPHDTA